MRVFVTGEAGFIGFHVSMTLLEKGYDVLGMDALTDYYDPVLKARRLAKLLEYGKFRHVTADVQDEDSLRSQLMSFNPEVVIHLAAQAGVRYSIENPAAYVSANVRGTQVLFESLREIKPRHTLVASTSSVYGGNTEIPFSEQHTTQSPVSLYAATKLATEAIAHSYSHLHELPVTCFRFFTVYGPWGRPDMALFKFVKAIRAGEPIDVYGHGKMRRDFTYIDDLVAAVTRLVEQPPAARLPVGPSDTLSPVAPYRIVNIGGGAPSGLMDFIAAVEDAIGEKAKLNLMEMQPGDVVSTFADNRLLRELIGDFTPTPLVTGVSEFVRWYDSYVGTADGKG